VQFRKLHANKSLQKTSAVFRMHLAAQSRLDCGLSNPATGLTVAGAG
jgi:hypothetical protein